MPDLEKQNAALRELVARLRERVAVAERPDVGAEAAIQCLTEWYDGEQEVTAGLRRELKRAQDFILEVRNESALVQRLRQYCEVQMTPETWDRLSVYPLETTEFTAQEHGMPHQKLEVGDTFTTKGGLEMEVTRWMIGVMYECVHRPTNFRGRYLVDGRYLGPAALPDTNLDADFYEAEK